MLIRDETTIAAPTELIWQVFTDVERWPEWTASVTEISAVNGDDLHVGATFHIKQPRMPKLVWVVTALDPGRSWTWTAKSPGATTSATHVVEALDAHTTRVEQRIEQTGLGGVLVGLLMRARTRRYLRLEAEGLRDRCETVWSTSSAPA